MAVNGPRRDPLILCANERGTGEKREGGREGDRADQGLGGVGRIYGLHVSLSHRSGRNWQQISTDSPFIFEYISIFHSTNRFIFGAWCGALSCT